MSYSVEFDGINKMMSESERTKRRDLFSRRCAFIMRQYVPVEETTLRSSEPLNSDYRKGRLVWNTPYAMKQYMVPMNHSDPGTTDHWDEKCWKEHKNDLIDFAEKLYGGY